MILSLLACRPGPALLDGPSLATPPHAPLARALTVATDVPTRLTVRLEGEGVDVDVAFPGVREVHDVTLLGAKPDRDIAVTITLAAEGRPPLVLDAGFRTEPLPEGFPRREVLALDPGAVEPGYVLLPLESDDRGHWLAAVDAWDGEVAWLYDGPENLGDVRRTPEGTFLGLGTGVLELDARGELRRRWNDQGDPSDPTWVPYPLAGEHHEVNLAGDDALVVLTHRTLPEPQYPVSYDPGGLRMPANLADVGIVVFGRTDGRIRDTFWYGDVLDPQRIGFDALDRIGPGRDWVHGNAVIPDPAGGWLASSRHQDALFALDDAGGLRWILASPAGFRDEWADALLTVEPAGAWTYHQHGPSFDPDGRVVVFDNHNHGHNPYERPPADPPESRIVAFEIDEDARRATVAWEWRHPDSLFSGALGNATALPGGTVVTCYGFLDAEGDGDNAARGLGRKVTRVVTVDPDRPDPISDLRFFYPAAESTQGVKSYRAVPTPTLYPDAVRVERRRDP